MLNLGESNDQTLSTASTWKVLVYDKFCQENGSVTLGHVSGGSCGNGREMMKQLLMARKWCRCC